MSPLVLGLVAVAAVIHALWNVVLKRAGATGAGFLWLSFLVGTLFFLPFGVWSLVESGADLGRWLGLAVVSGALQVAYFFLLQAGYRAGDVSVVYPLARGTGPLLSVIFAILLFGERPGVLALVGAAVVVTGVIVTGLAGRRTVLQSSVGQSSVGGAEGTAVVAGGNRAGILYGLATGVLIAIFTLWDSAAVTFGGMPAIGLYWGSVMFQFLLLAPLGLRERGTLAATAQKHWKAVLTVGICSPLTYMLILIAIQQAPVSLVAPAREVSVILVGLAGWLFFREPHPVRRLVGAAIVLGGIALLAVG